jgi:hypothetical protein
MSTLPSRIAVVALPPALAIPTVEGSLHFLLLNRHVCFCAISALPHQFSGTLITQNGLDKRGLGLTALGVREWEL